jgi:hypothetical protein
MAKYPEFAILRRFRRLNHQNLLYLQAQIIHTEEDLDKLAARDQAHPERQDYARDWWSLAHGRSSEAKQQWRKVRRMRSLLSRYSE